MFKNDKNEALHTQRLFDHVENGTFVTIKTADGDKASVPKFLFSFFCKYFFEECIDYVIIGVPVQNLKVIAALLRFELYEDIELDELDTKTLKDDASILGLSEASLSQLDKLRKLKTSENQIDKKEIDNIMPQPQKKETSQIELVSAKDLHASESFNVGSVNSQKISSTTSDSTFQNAVDMKVGKTDDSIAEGFDNPNKINDAVIDTDGRSETKVNKKSKAKFKTKQKKVKERKNVRVGLYKGCIKKKKGNPIEKIETNPITGRERLVSVQCRICGKVFERNENTIKKGFFKYNEHWMLQHEDCQCGISFSSKKARKKHFMTVHKGFVPCDVEGCKYVLKTEASLLAHKVNHHSKELTCEVSGCAFVTKRRLKLKDHNESHKRMTMKDLSSVNTTEQTFPCYLCENTKFFHNLGALNCHKTAVHEPKPCEICGDVIKNIYRLREHMSQVHDKGLRKFQCDTCEKSFYLKHKLDRHLILHSDVKYSCRFPGCENTTKFNEPSNRNAHERKKHSLSYDKFLSTSIKK